MNSDSSVIRPRRSCLYMPGANSRALDKARTLDADMLIFDLEDAVAPDAKEQAREAVAASIASGGYGDRELLVRVNPLLSRWFDSDLEVVSSLACDGILLPKVSKPEDIEQLCALLERKRTDKAHAFNCWAMIETPLAILNIREIAATARHTGLKGFVIGTNDLAKELVARSTPDRSAFQTSLSLSVAAARAFNLSVIDGVFNDIENPEGLRWECEQGRTLGFDGKSLIHPGQISIANEVFAPSIQEVNQAKSVIEAFAQPENQDAGVLKVNGKMTERLHLEQAHALVAMHEAILARS